MKSAKQIGREYDFRKAEIGKYAKRYAVGTRVVLLDPDVAMSGRDATLRMQAMTITLQAEKELVVPASVRRQAGIKSGDRVKFDVSAGMVIISPASRPTYKATKAELGAIRKGEAAIAQGEHVSLTEFLNDLDRPRRKTGAKTARKVSR